MTVVFAASVEQVEAYTLRVFAAYNTGIVSLANVSFTADSKRSGLLIISSIVSDGSMIMNSESVVCSSLLYLSSGLT